MALLSTYISDLPLYLRQLVIQKAERHLLKKRPTGFQGGMRSKIQLRRRIRSHPKCALKLVYMGTKKKNRLVDFELLSTLGRVREVMGHTKYGRLAGYDAS